MEATDGPSALCAIAVSAKSAPNSYMAREPNVPSDIQSIVSPETRLLVRSTLKRPDRPDRDEPARPKGQTRPIEERFLLRVDGQIKRSFSSKEATVTAGAKIKKAYPLVVVTVLGWTRVIHTNNARSLPRSRRRGGARRKAMLS